MNEAFKRYNGQGLAEATGLGLWVVYGIKKQNALLAARGEEPVIFSGRYSSPAKVLQWLDDHPDFVANQTLRAHRPKPARARNINTNPSTNKI